MAKPLPVWVTLLLLAALAFADGARTAAPAQCERDAAGRRVALKLPNGVTTTYAHDAAGRLTKVESKGAAGQTLYDENLTYDPVGNRLTQARTQIAAVNGVPQTVAENTVYAYNAANQLLTETTNGVTTAYGYDKNGNNTTISTPAANGAPAKNIAMTYDWLNRQTKWTDGERTESTVFAGADWKRASTTVTVGANGPAAPSTVTKYLYDGDNVLADCGNDNALTAFYVTPGLDQNLSVTDASGATSYYTQDGLGSVRLLTSTNGAILNRYANQVLRKIAEAPDPNLKVEGQTCKCIERLDIIGHGVHNFHEAQIVNDNGIEKIINPMTRDGWIGPRRGFTASMPHRRNTVLSEETAKNLFNHVSFCTPCVIRLWHCHIGKNMSLLREITVLTGCTTVANTGESIPKDWTNIEPKVNHALDVFYQGSAEMGKK